MAKIQKIDSRLRDDDGEEVVEEPVQPQSQSNPVNDAIAQRIMGLETRLEATDLALMEAVTEIANLSSLVQRLMVRLDEERELRIRANTDTIANMDQESLALRVFDVCMTKYLEYEANNFERLASDPSITKMGMKWLVKCHQNLVHGIEHALRMG